MFTKIKNEIDNSTERLPNIHPGEILLEDFLKPLNITPYKLSKDTLMTQTRVSQIIKGQRAITCNTALKFAKYFGTSPDFWLGLQKSYDLEEELKHISEEIDKIQPINQ